MIPALLAAAFAGEPVEASLHGDVKTFVVGTFPYDNPLLPADPFASGTVDGRLKLLVRYRAVSLEVHHALTVQTSGGSALSGIGTGVGLTAPEVVQLSYVPVDAATMRLQGRTDRLVLRASVTGLDVAVGRQPISFGHGLFFTPLDLVNPFFPTTIDQEYKPGVDAVRVDGYVGMATFTAVAAYAGDATAADGVWVADDWGTDTLALAAYGQGTVGVTDLGGFVGLIRGDVVLGATTTTSVGPVGIQSDVAVTLPAGDGEDPFFRGTAGALWRPFSDTTVMGEVYVQTLGKSDPADYLAQLQGARYARGELWLVGRFYAALAITQQIVPTLSASASGFVNLEDPSGFVSANLAWSVAANADVGVGAFVGLGGRPEGLTLKSEFGLYPTTAFVQVKTYF